MSRRIHTLVAAVAVLGASCDGNTESGKGPRAATRKTVAPARVPTSEWAPEASLLGQLAPETEVLGNPDCVIRPPAGYELQPLDTPPGSETSGARWTSPSRPDGTAHRLLVIIGRRPPGEKASPLEQFAKNFLKSRSRLVGPLQMQPVEYGRINGLKFARVLWSAKNQETGHQTHGFAYVATPGQVDIMIDSQDLEPHQVSTLAIADAAARTFQFHATGR